MYTVHKQLHGLWVHCTLTGVYGITCVKKTKKQKNKHKKQQHLHVKVTKNLRTQFRANMDKPSAQSIRMVHIRAIGNNHIIACTIGELVKCILVSGCQ